MLKAQQSVTVSELMDKFSVSIETIRRDLAQLEKQRLLQRVHGGAVSIKSMQKFSTLTTRMEEHREEKRQLSATAAGLLRDGETIAIESGSTAMELAQAIKKRSLRLTVITNAPDVFEILSAEEQISVIVIGGQYLREERSFYGLLAVEAIEKLHVSKVMICPSAISLRYGLSVAQHEVVPVSRAFIGIADQVFLLADSSKFETAAPVRVAPLSPAFTCITDPSLPEAMYDLYLESGIQVLK